MCRYCVDTRYCAGQDTAPREDCIDILVDSLKQEPASTQCVFSCQAGMGRTTLGTMWGELLYLLFYLLTFFISHAACWLSVDI